jgi:hypothetical protein
MKIYASKNKFEINNKSPTYENAKADQPSDSSTYRTSLK